MKAIINGKIILEDRQVMDGALLFDRKIAGIVSRDEAERLADEVIDARGLYVSPGFIDVHIHGFAGEDASDGDAAGLRKMAGALTENGVTSFLPTTMTIPWPEIEKALDTIRGLMRESASEDYTGAVPLGCHLEGPFIDPEKKGAQRGDCVLRPDADKVLRHADVIRLLTYAPEMDEGFRFTRRIKEESDIVLSVGHTSADLETALEAVHLGADHFTHTFNAMTPLKHRDPGVVGAALMTDAYTELIADTFHVHPAIFGVMARVKGDRLVLITDCLRAGGLTDGEYGLGGQKFFVKGIRCTLEDGTIAGSVLRMNVGVRNLRDHASLPMWQAVRAASLSPARSVRADASKGSLKAGKDADIILFDEDIDIKQVYIGGRLVRRA